MLCYLHEKMNEINQNKTTIIIPCFNESKRLNCNEFISFIQSNKFFNFLFVNDGSTDNTLEIIENLSKKNQQLSHLNLSKNSGKAEAIRQGVLSLQNQKNDYIGYLDADLSVPLSELNHFQNILNKNSSIKFLTGSRIARMGANINRKWYRHYLGRIFATLVSIMLKIPIYDTQCGAKVIHSSLIDPLFNTPFKSKWLFDVELIFRLINISEFKSNSNIIYEAPLSSWNEIEGSKVKLKDFILAPIELISIWKTYR